MKKLAQIYDGVRVLHSIAMLFSITTMWGGRCVLDDTHVSCDTPEFDEHGIIKPGDYYFYKLSQPGGCPCWIEFTVIAVEKNGETTTVRYTLYAEGEWSGGEVEGTGVIKLHKNTIIAHEHTVAMLYRNGDVNQGDFHPLPLRTFDLTNAVIKSY